LTTLFVSDLHLDADRPASIALFLRFLQSEAEHSDALFILGDLFEAWIGDDDDNPSFSPVLDALARLTGAGVPCFAMHGNRDFLLGDRFELSTGCRLLDEWHVTEIAGERVLMTHGDLLCTDDLPYQELRKTVRDETWQTQFLAKPLADRRAIAADLRQRSRTETAAKPAEIMDVNAVAVANAFRRHGTRVLIHGHTHRPAIHQLIVDDVPVTRVVLGAWYEEGSVLRWDTDGYRLETL
jgi:UDP-2,3-diacylglucosamine hydrolase